ncbi:MULTISPECIES: hypothetical protein [Prosthecochloris]|uniref:Alpha/beta hydrolase n=1 Tax=Prosthecochloris vibrioformis TaxID=1098 RepID=A0A5C4RXP1_PROVB|nr:MULTISPECIES: hypothetical protein [Prosthecochloris]ANT64817.1 hypothetical protein Ptc2401_01039 [Prosthecochloris sp. CIB 2401]TNJ36076.1 hypothetical protein FGF68_08535 [Prosthecochloris vibrioformis]
MDPIRIDQYCFNRFNLWLQYDHLATGFIELAIEVYYPYERNAEGLVVFSHGFLVGDNLLYYPEKLLDLLLNREGPLFQKHPSSYYNYTSAAVPNNWAYACVTACHKESEVLPWTDFGGNPRVGQEAYAAASYLVRYGATAAFNNEKAVAQSRFMNNNRVLFAGHSVGGAHAQAAACGFDFLRAEGDRSGLRYEPRFFDREILPYHTDPLAEWGEELLASPAGHLQLSPVDMTRSEIGFGMQAYREFLAGCAMPGLMVLGECDCAALDDSTPPAWSPEPSRETQYSQLAGQHGASWVLALRVAQGSHCGYLSRDNFFCSRADKSRCGLCADLSPYKAGGGEYIFVVELLDRILAYLGSSTGQPASREEWTGSEVVQWLNRQSPEGTTISLLPAPGGGYVEGM